MKREDRALIETLLKQTLYGITNQFLTTEITTEIENPSVTKKKNSTLKKVHEIVDKEVANLLKKLDDAGITNLKDFDEQQDVVKNLIGNLETKMRHNAEKLSK